MDEGPGDAKRSAGVRGLTARQAVGAKNLTFEMRKAIIIYNLSFARNFGADVPVPE